eukprot:gene23410-biopygen9117
MASMVSTVDSAIAKAWAAIAANATTSSSASTTTVTYVDGPSTVTISVVKPAVNASGGAGNTTTTYSVVLPGSGTSVNIVGLSTTSSPSTTAIVVTTVEVEANRFAAFGSKNTSADSGTGT